MANDYLSKFQDEFNKNKDFKNAVVEAVTLYLEKNTDELASYPALKTVLTDFIAHAKSSEMGNIIIDYTFKATLPEDLQELVVIAKLLEKRTVQSSSPLVGECENLAAAEVHSPKIIFEMSARLERALIEQKVPAYHRVEVEAKCKFWEELLYGKFADLMLKAKDINDLKALFEENFSAELVKDLPKLGDLRDEFLAQIEYLEEKGFFEEFFSQALMSDRFDHVEDFYQTQKVDGFVTTELRATLSKLFFQIIEKAYAPCVVEKFKLMSDPKANIDELFETLKTVLKEGEWKAHAGSDLEAELEDKLSTDETNEKNWEEVAFRHTERRLPAFAVHCFKYAGDPNADPKDLLKLLKYCSLSLSFCLCSHYCPGYADKRISLYDLIEAMMSYKIDNEFGMAVPRWIVSYPNGPYRFINREFFNIAYETDMALLRKFVPAVLEIPEPIINYEFIRMPDSTGFGDYTESGIVVPVRYKGEAGTFTLAMFLDCEAPIAGGREIWGYPKKLAKPKLFVEEDVLIGELNYGSVRIATATMGYKYYDGDANQILDNLKKPIFLLKNVPDVSGAPLINQLTRTYLEDVTVKGAWTGPGSLELHHHALAPVADFAIKRIISATHFITDLTLPYGEVVEDFLKR